MKLNADIARNNAKRQPEDLREFWNSLKDRLNLLGPPMKEANEWKKVWSDYKSHLKKKLSHNRQEQRATGGGPNKIYKFSDEEEEVIALVGLKEAVEGIRNVPAFGCPSNLSRIQETSKRRRSAEDDVLVEVFDNDEIVIENLENLPKKPAKQMTPNELSVAQYELMKTQIEIKKKLCDAIQTSIKTSQESSRDLQYNTRRIYKALDEIKVQNKQHNDQMQKLAVDKLKLKKQLLQLELNHKMDDIDQ